MVPPRTRWRHDCLVRWPRWSTTKGHRPHAGQESGGIAPHCGMVDACGVAPCEEHPSRLQTPAALTKMKGWPRTRTKMTPTEMTVSTRDIGLPGIDPGELLTSRRARDAMNRAVMGRAKDRRASPIKTAIRAAVIELGVLASDETFATPISATYSAKYRAGQTSTATTDRTSATVALVECDGIVRPSFSGEWCQSAGNASGAPRSDLGRRGATGQVVWQGTPDSHSNRGGGHAVVDGRAA